MAWQEDPVEFILSIAMLGEATITAARPRIIVFMRDAPLSQRQRRDLNTSQYIRYRNGNDPFPARQVKMAAAAAFWAEARPYLAS
jgi:hypothetical protein